MSTTRCEHCGVEYGIGDSPWCRDGHAPVVRTDAFHAGYDIGLGREVANLGDVRQAMRRHKLDYRDHPSPGERAARRDRMEARRREAAR